MNEPRTSQRTMLPRTSFGRKLTFRCLAIFVGLLPVLGLELGLRAMGWADPALAEDPLVGFSGVKPLFVLNPGTDRYEIPESRQEFFRPDSFPARKSNKDFRIFCFGGSTVQGRPYAIETSFTSWLELSLTAADPSRTWDVINCGGVSYASYRLVPILQESLRHQPDLLIVYSGHNEFLEDRSYHDIKQRADWLTDSYGRVSNLRTYALLRCWWRDWGIAGSSEKTPPQSELPAEVDALLDYQGGLEAYHRDDQWQAGVIAHYEVNMRRMIAIAKSAGVPLILVNPVSNVKDCPPFKMSNRNGISAEDQQRFNELWDQAKRIQSDSLDQAVDKLTQALSIDDRHAGLHFHLGHCREQQQLPGEAKAAFLRAKDEDLCPLRMLEPMHEILNQVAGETNTPLVDARGHFEQQAANGLIGELQMVDHVHPTINGHQQIAELLCLEMKRLGYVSMDRTWQSKRQSLFRQHLDNLDPSYFPKGEQRLAGLRRWTEGRVFKVRQPSGSSTSPLP